MKCIIFLVIAPLCHLTVGYGYHNRHNIRRHDDYSELFLNNYQTEQRNLDPMQLPDPPAYQPYGSNEDMYEESSGDEATRTKYSSGSNNYLVPNWMLPFTTTTRRQTTTEKSLSASELTASCIRSCPVTSEYNPVCGTDNVTYQNRGRLECAQNCGVRVQLSRLTSCFVTIPNPITTSPATTPSTTTPTTTTRHTTTSTTSESYFNGNGQNSGNNGNSGNLDNNNNGNTDNKEYDENVENHRINENSSSESTNKGNKDNDNQGNSIGCNTNTNTKRPSVEEVMACTQLCPLSSEYNPVCGTDGITYSNPGRLLCSQYCGIDVKVKKFAPCSSNIPTNIYTNCQCPTFTNPPSTDSTVTVTTPSFVQTCLEACPASMAFSPVCGSDNITYQNLDKLNCARRCGIEVGLQSMSACRDAGSNVAPLVRPTDPSIPSPLITQECIKQCSVNLKYEPICGTDNVTYKNTGHLICARQCGVDVEIKATSACSDTSVPSSTSSTVDKQTVTPYPNGLNFTIPPDVLASIFPDDNHRKPDDDEDIDIDKRFKEENNQTYT